MQRRIVLLITALMLVLPMAHSGVAAQDEGTIMVKQDANNGAILVDAEGRTLYLFTPDTTANESTCYDQCAEAWPILTPEQGATLAPGIPGELTVIERTDGTEMVAYNGIPLYYFVRDEAPGDVNGQGVGGVWFVVHPGSEHGPYAAAPGEGTPAPASSLEVGFTEELGPFLTDAEGNTVYLFTQDTEPGETVCYDDCAVNWPPVPAGETMVLPPGIPGELTSVERTDGTAMVAYNDIPLYYFIGDEAAGDTNGQDVGEVWYIVPPGMMHGDEPHEGTEAGEEDEGEEATPEA